MEHTVSVNSKAVETKWGWQVYTRMMNGNGFIPQGSPHKTLDLAIADCEDFDAPPPPGPGLAVEYAAQDLARSIVKGETEHHVHDGKCYGSTGCRYWLEVEALRGTLKDKVEALVGFYRERI